MIPTPRQAERSDPYLTGYRAPIYQALWKRILRWGAPRVFSAVWVALCLYGVLVCLFAGVPKCIILVGILWAIVQLGAALVTAWDVQWDAVLAASPRYRKFYDHG
jgi:hypothetical protein